MPHLRQATEAEIANLQQSIGEAKAAWEERATRCNKLEFVEVCMAKSGESSVRPGRDIASGLRKSTVFEIFQDERRRKETIGDSKRVILSYIYNNIINTNHKIS